MVLTVQRLTLDYTGQPCSEETKAQGRATTLEKESSLLTVYQIEEQCALPDALIIQEVTHHC